MPSVHHLARAPQRSTGSPRAPRRLAAVLLASVAALALLGSPARAASAPPGFFGVGGWSYPTDAQASSLAGAGLRLVRGALVWGIVQPAPDPASRNWNDADRLARDAARDGFDLILDLNGCAVWACGTLDAPPTGDNLTRYEDFVRAAVARYGPDSPFWAGEPRVPHVSWQVWNEVNGGSFWPDPTPAAYATFLGQIATTIKTVDPTATVVMSGLVEQPSVSSGMGLQAFLSGLYQQPGFTANTAAIVVHGYAPDPAGSLHVLDEARGVALRNGDGARPMWVTEMSWGAGGPPLPFTVSLATQALYLRLAWEQMLACRARWNLDHVLWFALQDVSSSVFNQPDAYNYYYGLLNRDGSPKPAYASFLQFLTSASLPDGGGAQCGLPGGLTLDVAAPHTAITAAPVDTNDPRSALVSFTAEENGQPVAGMRFQCSLDGAPWAACSSPLNAASEREGDHTLLVRGVDPQGNTDPTPASVTWLLDLTAPNTVITSVTRPASGRPVATVSFTGVDAGGMGSFECRVDATPWQPCASPYATPALRAGRHLIAVRAIDRAGNVDLSPAHVAVTVPGRAHGRRSTTRRARHRRRARPTAAARQRASRRIAS